MNYLYISLGLGVLAIAVGLFFAKQVKSMSPGNEKMQEVGRAIQNVAKLTENNSGNATNMAASAEELSAQAIAMKELVRRFQI